MKKEIDKKEENIDLKALTYSQILSRSDTIEENEKKYYQSDSYYTNIVFENSFFQSEVIPFEKRVKSAIPSSTGLYVPEILMLHFCKNFPGSPYPSYWWFQYGVRNIGAMLKSLDERGYIEINSKKGKYQLTAKGKTEETENEYVYFTHNNSLDKGFDAWKMNLLLGHGDKNKYYNVFKENCNYSKIDRYSKEFKIAQVKANPINNEEILKILYESDEKIKNNDCETIDKYIEIVNLRDAQYKVDKDVDSYIEFWEDNWKNNRPLLGAHWAFVLPDLYIKTKRFDNALKCIEKLDNDHRFAYKARTYHDKIEEKIKKQRGS